MRSAHVLDVSIIHHASLRLLYSLPQLFASSYSEGHSLIGQSVISKQSNTFSAVVRSVTGCHLQHSSLLNSYSGRHGIILDYKDSYCAGQFLKDARISSSVDDSNPNGGSMDDEAIARC